MSITTVYAVVMLLLFSASCSKEPKDVVEVVYDPETTYTLKTTDVYTLISDSGLVRYRIIADEWYDFGNASEPYWYFPEGFYLEKFDTLFRAEGSVKSDTAYNWSKKNLWKLVGNVEIVNLKGDSIETELLYWDRNEEKIYTHVYARIVREDGTVIIGQNGFETTQEMSNYIFYAAQGEFLMNESSDGDSSARDSTANDSTKVVTPRPTAARRPTPPPHNPALMNPARRNLPVPDSLEMAIPAELLEEREQMLDSEALQPIMQTEEETGEPEEPEEPEQQIEE